MGMEVWWRAEGFGQLRGKRKGVRGFWVQGIKAKNPRRRLRLEKGSDKGRRKIKNQWGAAAFLFGQVGGVVGWFEGDGFLGLGFFCVFL